MTVVFFFLETNERVNFDRFVGRQEELKNREKAHELYLEVKSEVESCLSYLKEKREGDPYRSILSRLVYQLRHGRESEIPTFEP